MILLYIGFFRSPDPVDILIKAQGMALVVISRPNLMTENSRRKFWNHFGLVRVEEDWNLTVCFIVTL